jgi:peroxiredoxin Q/BCP
MFALAALALCGMALAAGPEVGQPAPAIRLQDQHGNWITLDQQKGKWVVLYFYPKDNTPGCTTQACEFRDNIFAVRKANAVILGVSVDDLESHKKFSEEHGLPFSILADANKEASTRYGVLTKFGPNEVASRVTYLIDPQGKIAKRYVVDPPSLNGHSQAVLADIAAMSAAGKSGA